MLVLKKIFPCDKVGDSCVLCSGGSGILRGPNSGLEGQAELRTLKAAVFFRFSYSMYTKQNVVSGSRIENCSMTNPTRPLLRSAAGFVISNIV